VGLRFFSALEGCGVVIAVVASSDPVTRAEIHKAWQGWMGEARRLRPPSTREKKCWQGLGSSLRKLFSLSAVADAIFVSLWTELFWPAMGLQMLGEKRPAFSGCFALPLYGSSAHLYSRTVSKR
jgi:hypothetical protein